VIFVDTSAWIEFLRDTGSEVCALVEESLAGEAAICDAVRMEVLAGARNEAHVLSLRGLIASVATRVGAPISRDVDFDVLARRTEVRTYAQWP
jgi:predicted nucleic acid-binding protein